MQENWWVVAALLDAAAATMGAIFRVFYGALFVIPRPWHNPSALSSGFFSFCIAKGRD
jgi:predicted membrane-bound mannosyltransferase